MIGTHDLFVSFIVSDSGMYEGLGRRTKHVVQGSVAIIFQMESWGLCVASEKCAIGAKSVFLVSAIEE
jgi:hypothetical protein